MHLGYHGNGRHFEFVHPPQKLPHNMVDILTKFHNVWWKESKFLLNTPLFCFYDNCGKVCPTDSDFSGLSHSTRLGCCSYQVSSISVRAYDVSWSLMKEIKMKRMKGIQFIFKSHFFCFHGNCCKFAQPISIVFDLSRSTRCSSYQVSSISVLASNLLWSFLCFSTF